MDRSKAPAASVVCASFVSSWAYTSCGKKLLLFQIKIFKEWVLFNMRRPRHFQKNFLHRMVVQTYPKVQAGLLLQATTNEARKGIAQWAIRKFLSNTERLLQRVWQLTMNTFLQVANLSQERNVTETEGKAWTKTILYIKEILPQYKMAVQPNLKWR